MSETRHIDRINGSGIVLRGGNIDTDRIIPARFLKAVTFEGLGDHVFEDDRVAMPDHPFSDSRYRQAKLLFVNENFGSGSSREHAPQALKRWGIIGCIGESFSEIFQGNSLAIGLVCVTSSHDEVAWLMDYVEQNPSAPLELSVSDLKVQAGNRMLNVAMPEPARHALLNGHWDATGLLLDRFEEVQAVSQKLPYIDGFVETKN
tara:strand:- start:12445 stop:13056 length:612 start_codon:yes stop_codon:yes gene_type:complete